MLQFPYDASWKNLPVCLLDYEDICISQGPVKDLGVITTPTLKWYEDIKIRIKNTHIRWMMILWRCLA